MKHEFMKKIRNANTNEELKAIMIEVMSCHAEGTMSDEAFEAIYDMFIAKKAEF